jgi:coenzyme Q-binding protein COQ10
MAKASKCIEINRSPKTCYDVVADFAKYPEFLDEVKGVKVLESTGESWKVEYVVQMMKKVEYTLRHKGIPGKELSWSQVKGFFKTNDGKWVFEELEGGKRTKVTYTIDVELGMLVPGKIVAGLTEKQLPKMLETFKARIEGMTS